MTKSYATSQKCNEMHFAAKPTRISWNRIYARWNASWFHLLLVSDYFEHGSTSNCK